MKINMSNIEFNDKVKNFIYSNGLTQKIIADLAKVDRSRLNKVLNGHCEPSERMKFLINKVIDNYESKNN